MHVYKTIIIGAGVAGLAAAKFFSENGHQDFLILEAQDRIGGRIDTIEFGSSGPGKSIIELGAQWIHGEDNDFLKLVDKEEMRHKKTSWEGEGEFRTKTGESIPKEKVQEIVDWVNKTLDEIEAPEIIPYGDSFDDEKEDMDFTNDSSVGSLLKTKFEDYLNESKDDLPREIQMAIFQWTMSFQRIDNACHQMTDLSLRFWPDFEINGGELYNNFKSGATKMLQKMSQKFLTPGNIKLSSPVSSINWQTEEIQIFITNPNNQSNVDSFYLCQSVVITCSIGVLKLSKSLFSPPLPVNISYAIESTGFGPLTKIFLEWDKPWWPEDFRGLQLLWPEEYINCCDHSYDAVDMDAGSCHERYEDSWVKAITGFDPVLDNPNVLLAWLGGPEATHVESLDVTVVIQKCTQVLREFTGASVPTPKSAVVSKWSSNPYIRGAYCYRSVAGDKIPGDIASILTLPIYNEDDLGLLKPALIFAGEAIHKSHYSTVHGAYESGQSQAQLLLELFTEWQQQREHE
ncbi:unnamed protein product [Allacma fusca]|uniref:Amine oxidase domain-containing protein n=1 Tax=Allacma fusca TaxID=39272 RepID=A0A8J2P6I7_9HEXA|nr:unnamed protein product [Allacma fusca]